jgi:hypothetical protein
MRLARSSPAPGGVIALDLGGMTCGWAYGHMTDRSPIFGSWHMPKVGGEGARFAALENELASAMELLQPTDMILEAMLPLMAQTNMVTFRIQAGMRAMAASEAWRASCAFSERDVWTIRHEVIGQASFPKGRTKSEVVRFCREQGWPVQDDHQADACITWRWLQMRRGGIRPMPGPLWRAIGTA